MQRSEQKKSGFTLAEILISVAIIAILVAVAVPNINDGKSKARDLVRIKNLDEIQAALHMYYLDHGHYPITHWESAVHDDLPVEFLEQPHDQGLQYYLNGAGGNYLLGDPPEWGESDSGGSWYYHIYPWDAGGYVLCIMTHFEDYNVLQNDLDNEDQVPGDNFGIEYVWNSDPDLVEGHSFGSDPGDGVYCKGRWRAQE